MDSSPTPVPGTNPTWPIHAEFGADPIGEVIDDRYRIVERLAKGGMAHVFLAKDLSRRCHVALKLLHRTGPEARRRFEVEAEVLSNIQHPHIVRAIAFGHMFDAQPYMALEYLEGETLAQRLARGPLPWREVVEFGAQIAGALHALHSTGVIHRDVKPDNIMIAAGADRAVARLIDLGLASVGTPFHEAQDARFASQVPERHRTQLGRAIGTPAYLPPEAGLRSAEPRLDVYSLGVTLYQLCTRSLPDLAEILPIQEVCPDSDAPADLSRLLRAAIDPEAAERLPSADHLRRGLEAILAAHPRTPRPLFGGCYDRLEVIGVGASAVVYRASDRELSREVALKVLRDARPSEDDTLRFRRAAKILSALRHPNIPQIHHFGVHFLNDRARDEGQRFAVMELCRGSPASEFTRPGQHLRIDEVMAVGRQLASALAAVHAVGVVYRDLHVGNVLIARGETPHAWIFDFDQAQVSPVFYARVTERWATPPEDRAEPANERPLQRMDYAPPEVRAGDAFTAASDVFALGHLLYRLLTGLRPFPPGAVEATPARKACRGCPPGLEHLLLSMLRADPSERPTLAMVQAVLEDEQAELEAERDAEREEAALVAAASAPRATAVRTSGGARAEAAPGRKVVASSDGTVSLATGTSPVAALRRASRLAVGLVATLGVVAAWWWFRSGEMHVAPAREQAPAEHEAAAAPPAVLLERGERSHHGERDMSFKKTHGDGVAPVNVPVFDRTPDASTSEAERDMSLKTHEDRAVPGKSSEQMPDTPSSEVGTARPQGTATRPARSRKQDPVVSWEARMRKAEARARRCLDAAGAEPRRVVVTLSPGAPVEFGGVSSSSVHAQCLRDALAGLDLRDVRRRHTFFETP
ncbi:serine/threonine-protein kinase [Nannocystis punicea]|uniref:Serine/threonine-protein kinase n=1 Tax=Nannocystis punicea TaxID=2995304 RepID=A0ABY7H7L7_9BACT|nr:serine/threonine-protein kinase [Nannocystis poenicansa]WAS95080.1 serine/threonine-protein kinase [Nannocystis poenicansa]